MGRQKSNILTQIATTLKTYNLPRPQTNRNKQGEREERKSKEFEICGKGSPFQSKT